MFFSESSRVPSCCMLLLLILGTSFGWSQATACGNLNFETGPFVFTGSNTSGHITGNHNYTQDYDGTCLYGGNSGTCQTQASADSNGFDNESGSLISLIYEHVGTTADKNGTTTATGAATADAEGAAAFANCLTSTCAVQIGISGSGNGAGFTVTFGNSPTPIWTNSHYYKNQCPAKSVSSSCTYTPPPYPDPGAGCSWVYNSSFCTWSTSCQPTGSSPIIVDTNHTGFHLTDPQAACVTFNLSGTPACYSWPQHGSGNAWLVYDADGDGVIDSGKELFGHFTPHADADWAPHKTASPNGFLALAWFDQPAQGGDGNLIIDKRDQIWTKLKLWIDDHCYLTPTVPCTSRPGELHPLDEFGINSISLVYTGFTEYTDGSKNDFRFSAVLNPDAETHPINAKGESCCDQHQHSSDGRMTYDVWLQTKQ
jgi:hypothetical protein